MFHNVEYADFEEEALGELEEELKKHPEIVLDEEWTRVESLKMLYNAKFNVQKAVEVGVFFLFFWIFGFLVCGWYYLLGFIANFLR